MGVWDWGEDGLQEKLNEEMEGCLFLHVPMPVDVCGCCAGQGLELWLLHQC